jgi:SAM-dependent methyltransferase
MSLTAQQLKKAALRGEPSHVWRAGQERRLKMIREAAGERLNGCILEDGCGEGAYLQRLAENARQVVGLDIEMDRTLIARQKVDQVICSVSEKLPFPGEYFDLVLSHEVIEHVQDDRQAIAEIVRVMKPGARLMLFCPNRGYPFETHGIYWHGRYHFGNIPFVNYLPNSWRNRLASHVRIYTRKDLELLFFGLPVRCVSRTIVFGGYDNIIARFPRIGPFLRSFLQWLEKTPLRWFGLSHFWVIERSG